MKRVRRFDIGHGTLSTELDSVCRALPTLKGKKGERGEGVPCIKLLGESEPEGIWKEW